MRQENSNRFSGDISGSNIHLSKIPMPVISFVLLLSLLLTPPFMLLFVGFPDKYT